MDKRGGRVVTQMITLFDFLWLKSEVLPIRFRPGAAK